MQLSNLIIVLCTLVAAILAFPSPPPTGNHSSVDGPSSTIEADGQRQLRKDELPSVKDLVEQNICPIKLSEVVLKKILEKEGKIEVSKEVRDSLNPYQLVKVVQCLMDAYRMEHEGFTRYDDVTPLVRCVECKNRWADQVVDSLDGCNEHFKDTCSVCNAVLRKCRRCQQPGYGLRVLITPKYNNDRANPVVKE